METSASVYTNLITGELLDYRTMTTDDILAELSSLEKAYETAKKALDTAKLTILERLAAQNATLYENDQFKVTRTTGKEIQYDLDKLLTLRQHLTPEQFEATFKIEYTPYKRELTKLVRLGGQVREIIESSTIETERPPRPSDLKVVPHGGEAA